MGEERLNSKRSRNCRKRGMGRERIDGELREDECDEERGWMWWIEGMDAMDKGDGCNRWWERAGREW